MPDSAFIETSSLINRPWNPINPQITCLTIVTEVVAGATGSIALNTTCAVIPSGMPANGLKAAKSVASSVARSVSTTGSLWWLSAAARPWPGRCFSDRKNAAGLKAISDRLGNCRDLARFAAIGAITDNRVAAGNRNVGDRKTIDVDAKRPEVGGDQMAGKARCRDADRRLPVIEFAIPRAGRVGRPMWRSKPLHPAAFLIHEHGRFPADDIAK